MFKKIILASAILAASSSVAFAAGPYVGASVGVNSGTFTLTDDVGANSDFGGRGAIGNLFAGYGAVVSQNIYLGGEVFADLTNTESKIYHSSSDNVTIKNKYGYGISFIPGLMLSDHTMIYARAGVVRTRFEDSFGDSVASYKNRKTLTGGQVGLGLQTSLTQNVDLRGEYDFTTYGSQTIDGTKIKPRTDTFTLGLIYKFD